MQNRPRPPTARQPRDRNIHRLMPHCARKVTTAAFPSGARGRFGGLLVILDQVPVSRHQSHLLGLAHGGAVGQVLGGATALARHLAHEPVGALARHVPGHVFAAPLRNPGLEPAFEMMLKFDNAIPSFRCFESGY